MERASDINGSGRELRLVCREKWILNESEVYYLTQVTINWF